MEEEKGMEVGEGKEETTIVGKVRIGMRGTGIIGIIIGTGTILHIVKGTWAPFRRFMGPETLLLAILIRASHLIKSDINHRMSDVAFYPCPACRMEVRAGV